MKKAIAERIREAREWRGITQVAMAEKLQIARQTYLDMETGKTEPKVRILAEVAEVTGRPLVWLVYGEVQMGKEEEELLFHFARLPYPFRKIVMKQAAGLVTCLTEHMKTIDEQQEVRAIAADALADFPLD